MNELYVCVRTRVYARLSPYVCGRSYMSDLCFVNIRALHFTFKVPLPPRVMRREVEIFPEQGPEAGGTNLTILLKSGIKEVHSVFLSLPQHEECSIIER